MRADAQRNRQRVLEVAQEVFAAEGLSVPIDEIARRAGLGVGTLYRHFPTKEALLEAILLARMEQVTKLVRDLADSEDPGAAFFGYLERMGEESISKKDLIEALNRAGYDLKRATEAKKELYAGVSRLLERAQDAGAVRKDVTAGEVLSLIAGTTAACERYGGDARSRSRMVAVVCDGLRAAKPARAGRSARSPTPRRG